MFRVDTLSKPDETSRRLAAEDAAPNPYLGVELAPLTVESLVTWDVSGHAQCEKNRLNSLWRGRRAGTMRGGY
jgi:hypothetical protein